MGYLRVWWNRIKKFRDQPMAIFPFLRKYTYYNFVSDSYISYYKDVHFLDYKATLEALLTDNKSIVRFGDELFDMLLGIGLYFNDWRQRYDPALAARLREIVSSREDRLLICFNPEFILKSKREFRAMGITDQHHFWTHSRVYLKDHIHIDQVYGRSLTFHPRYNPDLPYERVIAHLKQKHLIIVTSGIDRFAGRSLGLTTDYVEAPSSDAWDQYDRMLKEVRLTARSYDKDKTLIMASLGPAAKVMVYDLTKMGYVAWDTGQFFDLAFRYLRDDGSGKEKVPHP